jgi:MFS family permease
MLTIASILQGVALTKIGYATPFMVIGAAIGTISAGLFYTFDIDTSVGKWVGYQILCGFAVGGAFQTAIAVVQVNAAPEDMSSVTAMVFCESPLSGQLLKAWTELINHVLSLPNDWRIVYSCCSAVGLQQQTDSHFTLILSRH